MKRNRFHELGMYSPDLGFTGHTWIIVFVAEFEQNLATSDEVQGHIPVVGKILEGGWSQEERKFGTVWTEVNSSDDLLAGLWSEEQTILWLVLAWSLAGVKDNCLTEITAGDLL